MNEYKWIFIEVWPCVYFAVSCCFPYIVLLQTWMSLLRSTSPRPTKRSSGSTVSWSCRASLTYLIHERICVCPLPPSVLLHSEGTTMGGPAGGGTGVIYWTLHSNGQCVITPHAESAAAARSPFILFEQCHFVFFLWHGKVECRWAFDGWHHPVFLCSTADCTVSAWLSLVPHLSNESGKLMQLLVFT